MLISKYLDQISPYLNSAGYLFRGVKNSKYLLEASALRRMPEIIDSAGQYRQGELSRNQYISYNIELIKKARSKGYGEKSLEPLEDLDVLSELQHFGAATCLLDFSKSFLIALWFAIENDGRADGKVFVLNQNHSEISSLSGSEKELSECISSEKLLMWVPQETNKRIFSQSSVFVLGSPVIDTDKYGIREIIIKSEDKEVLQYELDKFFGIDQFTVFPDFQGFALSNAVNNKLESPSFDYLLDYFIEQGQWEELQKNISEFSLLKLFLIIQKIFASKTPFLESVFEYFDHLILKLNKNDHVRLIEIFRFVKGLSEFHSIQEFDVLYDLEDYVENLDHQFNNVDFYHDDKNKSQLNFISRLISLISPSEKVSDIQVLEKEINENPNINSALKNEIIKFINSGFIGK